MLVAFAILLSFGFSVCQTPWLRVGIGGSLVGQNYSLLERDTLALTPEGKLMLDGWRGWSTAAGSLRTDAKADVGNESVWAQAKGEWRIEVGKLEIKTAELVEGRVPYDEDSDITGYGKHRFNLKLSQKTGRGELVVELWVEGKRYAQTTSYNYNYNLLRSSVSYFFPLSGWDCEIGWDFSHRSVPDSASANYDRRRLSLISSKLWESGTYAELWLELDREHFPSETQEGSYLSVWLGGQASLLLGGVCVEPSCELERRGYDVQTDTYFDYTWLSGSVLLGKDIGGWHIAAGPSASLQKADPQYVGETFADVGLKLSTDCIRYGKFWIFATLEPGRRFYSNTADTVANFSNYAFCDLSVTAAVWIKKHLRADLSASYLPEWHRVERDDIAVSYLSLAVRYEFY